MKVAVDFTAGVRQHGGVGRYTRSLVRALAVALLDRIISYYSLILFGVPAFLITKRGR